MLNSAPNALIVNLLKLAVGHRNRLKIPIALILFPLAANATTPPVIADVNNVAGFVEDSSGQVTIDGAVTITDVDSTHLNQAAVGITNNLVSAEDRLVYSTVNGITGSYSTSTGVLILSGVATLSEYETALESVKYDNLSQSPSTATRTISYMVRDSDNVESSVVATTLTVTGANDAPVVTIASPADQSQHFTSQAVSFTGTASDAEDGDLGSTIEWESNIDGSLGTGASIQVSLTQATHTITASAEDSQSVPDDHQITVTVNAPSGNAPVAQNDAVTTLEKTRVVINVLINDSDVDSDDLTVTRITSAPSSGSAEILHGGQAIMYTTSLTTTGVVNFEYEITDGNGNFDDATVTVTVEEPDTDFALYNDELVSAANINGQTNAKARIDVLGNDILTAGGLGNTDVTMVGTPANGTAQIVDNIVIYTPDVDFVGIDTFTYTAEDNQMNSDTATVAIDVGGLVAPGDAGENDLIETFLSSAAWGNMFASSPLPNSGVTTLDPHVACETAPARELAFPPETSGWFFLGNVSISLDDTAKDLEFTLPDNEEEDRIVSRYLCNITRTDQWLTDTFQFVNHTGQAQYPVAAVSLTEEELEELQELEDCKNNGEPGNCPVGNPINVATGNKFQIEDDYVSPASFLLNFSRYYNSNDFPPFDNIGNHWRTSFDAHVRLVEDQYTGTPRKAQVFLPDGKRVYFFRSDEDEWYSQADVTARLSELVNGDNHVGWVYEDEGDLVYTFRGDGRVQSVETRAGFAAIHSYNALGQRVSVRDPYGRRLLFTYDMEGRIETMTDPDGGVYTYEYSTDGHNNLLKVTYPDDTPGSSIDNPVREYHYEDTDFPNALTGITDENQDRFATWAYDDEGRAIMSQHAGGAEQVDLVFNMDGTTTVTDALGAVRTYEFEIIHGVRKTIEVTGNCGVCSMLSQQTAYDANGFPDTTTDFKGFVTDYTFNSRGLEESRIEASGQTEQRTVTTQWHTDFRKPTLVTEPRRSIEYAYDSDTGLVETMTVTDIDTGSPDYLKEYVTTFTYYQTGPNLNRLETINGPRTDVTDVTTYSYDTAGNLIEIENAAGHITEFTSHDDHGRPLTIEDANNVTTALTYDALGRLKTSTVNGTATTSYDYDKAGQVIKITRPDGSFLEYFYDEAHRLERIEDNLGNYIEYTLDEMGNREAEEVYDSLDSLKKTWTAVYDTLGRLEELTGASSQTTVYGYDDNNNLTSITDPRSNETVRAFDALNRLKTVTDPNGVTTYGGITEFGYDAQDQLTSVEDARGLTTTYTYNGLGELKTQVSPDTGTTTYSYDSAGNRTGQVDAKSASVSYSYDVLNRLTTVDAIGTADDIGYVYDSCTLGVGRLCSVTRDGVTVSYAYDAFGNVATVEQEIAGVPPLEVDTTYNYDTDNKLDNIVYPSGMAAEYAYDSLGRISSITLNNGSPTILIENVTYQPFGPVNAYEQGNGVDIDMTYDQDGRIDTLDDTGSVLDLDYAYDAAGNIQSVANAVTSALSRIYSYDPLNRLTEETTTGGTPQTLFDYDHDRVGNRTDYEDTALTLVQEHEYLTGNRLTKFDGVTVVSDNNGNITDLRNLDLSYDVHNRLASATVGGNATTYKYNGHGERVTRSNASGTVHYYYGANRQLLAECDGSGNVEREYVYFNGQPVVMLDHTGMSLVIYWIHNDHLGRPLALTNNSGAVVWRWLNGDAFGNAADVDEDPDNDTNDLTFNLRFPGQYFDAETGLHYNYFRYYDPQSGRYITSDPIGLKGGLNTYGYVGGKPTNYFDILGLDEVYFNLDSGKASIVDNQVVDIIRIGNSSIIIEDITRTIGTYEGMSGPHGRGSLDPGHYVGSNLRLRTEESMTCYTGYSLDLDPAFETDRTLLRIHPDGNVPGTLGCIGINCEDATRFYGDLQNSLDDSGEIDVFIY